MTAMRRSVLLVLAAVGVLAAVPAAGAAGPATISVVSISVPPTPVNHDKPPKGMAKNSYSKGDTIVFKDRLVNAVAQFGKKKGAVVGSDHGTMTFLSAHSARFDGKAVLPGGTLTLKGVIAGAGSAMAIPVTGGTGRYAGAHGIVVVGPGAKQSLNVYHLQYSLVA